ncbi:uncharacterized protein LOC141948653 [Strix uralensis]|uniref:uncharacterized protein LOC141948653 n=1 Tax=Strix uralensis TaxID=36305 RepID=UPI003DA59F79
MARRTHIPGSPRRREGAAALPGWGRCGRGFAGASPPSPAGQRRHLALPRRLRVGRAPSGEARERCGGSASRRAAARRGPVAALPRRAGAPPAGRASALPRARAVARAPRAGAPGEAAAPEPLSSAVLGPVSARAGPEGAAAPGPAVRRRSRERRAEARRGEGEAEVLTVFPWHLTFSRKRMHPRAEAVRSMMGKTNPAVQPILHPPEYRKRPHTKPECIWACSSFWPY